MGKTFYRFLPIWLLSKFEGKVRLLCDVTNVNLTIGEWLCFCLTDFSRKINSTNLIFLPLYFPTDKQREIFLSCLLSFQGNTNRVKLPYPFPLNLFPYSRFLPYNFCPLYDTCPERANYEKINDLIWWKTKN